MDKFKIGDKVLYALDLKGAKWQKGIITGNNFDGNDDIRVYYIKDENDEIWPISVNTQLIFPYEDYMIYYIGKKVRSNDPRIIPNEYLIK